MRYLKWDAFFMPGKCTAEADTGMRFTPGKSMLPSAAEAARTPGERGRGCAWGTMRAFYCAEALAAAARGSGGVGLRGKCLTMHTQHIARSNRDHTNHSDERREGREGEGKRIELKAMPSLSMISASCWPQQWTQLTRCAALSSTAERRASMRCENFSKRVANAENHEHSVRRSAAKWSILVCWSCYCGLRQPRCGNLALQWYASCVCLARENAKGFWRRVPRQQAQRR